MQPDAVATALFVLLAIVLIARDQGGYFPTSWGWGALALLGVLVTWLAAAARTDAGRFDVAFLAALALLTGWVALSTVWSVDRPQSVLEVERWCVLVAGCAALLALARRAWSAAWLVPAILAAATGVCAYSLATRLDPSASSFHPRDPTAGYRLFEPLGYWNALGGFAALAILLGLGLAAETAAPVALRAFGALSLVALVPTLYFTFSRGAWVALVGGLAVFAAWSPHRLRVAVEAPFLAAPAAVAVVLASRSSALTDESATLHAAQAQGHRLALILVALAVAAVAIVLALAAAETRVTFAPKLRSAFGAALVFALLLACVGGIVHAGGASAVVRRGYNSFVDPLPPRDTANLNSRLLDLNGNGRAQLWSAALDALHGGRWVTGTGAGGFERTWEADPAANEVVRDAHGLYVETLSELGIVGLVLLVVTLLIPLGAGLRRRRAPYAAAVAGAYATFLFHNAVDWDWELAGVALTGLFLGCLLVTTGRVGAERTVPHAARAALGAAAAALAAFAFVAAIGNGALARAEAANRSHRYAAATTAAATARTWMPWSAAPLKALGTAQLELRQTAAARASFRRAIAIDPHDWQGWLDLAAAVDGPARTKAVARARALYPTSPEITEFEDATDAR